MARYSSDSDSDRSNRHRRKHRRSRSSSLDSSDSSSYRKRLSKHSRSKRRQRTRSKSRERDRTSKSYKPLSGSSKDRDKRRYRSKKSRSYSPDRNKRKGRSPSEEKSSSRSSSASVKPIGEKSTSSFSRDEFTIEPRIKESVLEEINSESFTPKAFTSSASSKDNSFRNVVIDVSAETIQTLPVRAPSNAIESIFHTSIMMDQEARFDKWVKKLYTLRQKAIIDVTHTNVT